MRETLAVLCAALTRKTLYVVYATTGAITFMTISSKFLRKTFCNQSHLIFIISSFELYFNVNTHLYLITFMPGGGSTSSYVLICFLNEVISSSVASYHLWIIDFLYILLLCWFYYFILFY